LISIPVTNTSVNPARSTEPAIFVGGWALQQLGLFRIAPIMAQPWPAWSTRARLKASASSRLLLGERAPEGAELG
jgi:aquaporin Z